MRSFIASRARGLARSFVRIYYPIIEVTGAEFIPKHKPVLLVANHANSLIDPVMVGMASGRAVRFFAKAPLFETPVLGPLMRALGMLPAFRGQDGASEVRRNLESLQIGAEALAQGEAVGIFPEGKSHDSLHLEQIRSGAARMAVQAMRQSNKPIAIVPVGINYERKERFRSAVWIRVGEPLRVDAISSSADDKGLTRILTVEIQKRLKSVVLHLEDGAYTSLLADLESLLPPRTAAARPRLASLRRRKRIADAMNYFLSHDRSRAELLVSAVEEFHEALRKLRLNCNSLPIRHSESKAVVTVMFHSLGLLIWMPMALAGVVFHFLPFVGVRSLARKVEQGPPTTALTRLGLGLPIYAFWYVGGWWSLRQFLPLWAVWLTVLLMPIVGASALAWCYNARTLATRWREQCSAWKHRNRIVELRKEEKRLCEQLQELSDNYQVVEPA